MSNIWIEESFVNRTKGYRIHDSEIHDSDEDNVGRLYKSLSREYGRCVSKVFVDRQGKTKAVGWVFEKKMRYDDARGNDPDDYYVREVWVTCYAGPMEHVRPEYVEVK